MLQLQFFCLFLIGSSAETWWSICSVCFALSWNSASFCVCVYVCVFFKKKKIKFFSVYACNGSCNIENWLCLIEKTIYIVFSVFSSWCWLHISVLFNIYILCHGVRIIDFQIECMPVIAENASCICLLNTLRLTP